MRNCQEGDLHPEISLESSEDVGVGAILGGVYNHINAFMLHPLKDQSSLLIEFKRLSVLGRTLFQLRFSMKACKKEEKKNTCYSNLPTSD